MPRSGEDKGYDNPLLPFVLAIILWMWAAVVYLSGDSEVKPFGHMTTELLKWAFGNVGGAIVLFGLGGLSIWAGIMMRRKRKESEDHHSDD
jgi:hypothetical protein